MNEYIVNCPCCGEQLKISIDSSGNTTAFLLYKNKISKDDLFQKYGIELGIVESEVNKN